MSLASILAPTVLARFFLVEVNVDDTAGQGVENHSDNSKPNGNNCVDFFPSRFLCFVLHWVWSPELSGNCGLKGIFFQCRVFAMKRSSKPKIFQMAFLSKLFCFSFIASET
jgi:hypothetical protein